MSNSSKKRSFDDLDRPADEVAPLFTMKPRKNDFSERTWWMVDIDGCDSNQGATALVKRCMRNYDWSLDKSKKILKAYRQFLTLKKELEDWDATVLSPSHLVDQMWHQHILDIGNYYHDMLLLCGGQIVLHNPDGALDQQAKKSRDERTRTELIKKFGSDNVDSEVWGLPSKQSSVVVIFKDHTESIMLDIVFKDHTNHEVSIRVKQNLTMATVERDYANRRGINQFEHKFVYNGERLSWDKTPEDFEVKNGDTIDVIRFPVKDITVRIRDQVGEVTVFKARTNTIIGKVFQKYAQCKGLELCSLRFLYWGNQLWNHEATPGYLEMEDEDEIDCFLYEDMLDIVFKDHTNHEMSLRVHWEMGAVMREYANRRGINLFEQKFVYNGKQLSWDDIPEDLEMENGDTIHVLPLPDEVITLRLKDESKDEETFFKIHTNTRIGKVFQTHAKRKGTEFCSLRFLYHGDRILDRATPGFYAMEDQDQIVCVQAQGGC